MMREKTNFKTAAEASARAGELFRQAAEGEADIASAKARRRIELADGQDVKNLTNEIRDISDRIEALREAGTAASEEAGRLQRTERIAGAETFAARLEKAWTEDVFPSLLADLKARFTWLEESAISAARGSYYLADPWQMVRKADRPALIKTLAEACERSLRPLPARTPPAQAPAPPVPIVKGNRVDEAPGRPPRLRPVIIEGSQLM